MISIFSSTRVEQAGISWFDELSFTMHIIHDVKGFSFLIWQSVGIEMLREDAASITRESLLTEIFSPLIVIVTLFFSFLIFSVVRSLS